MKMQREALKSTWPIHAMMITMLCCSMTTARSTYYIFVIIIVKWTIANIEYTNSESRLSICRMCLPDELSIALLRGLALLRCDINKVVVLKHWNKTKAIISYRFLGLPLNNNNNNNISNEKTISIEIEINTRRRWCDDERISTPMRALALQLIKQSIKTILKSKLNKKNGKVEKPASSNGFRAELYWKYN